MMLGRGVGVVLVLGGVGGVWSEPYCPEEWKAEMCLGSSGSLAAGTAVEYKKSSIKWEAGMSGHSHYAIEPSKTAVLVIDAQMVYAACPRNLTVEALVAGPENADYPNFDGHSPLCCENFYDVVANQNKIAMAARAKGSPVLVVAHVYSDADGDGEPDNCGRLCDFDALGWSGWPEVWNLWNEAMPWHEVVFRSEHVPHGFHADPDHDYYVEKSIFSAMTQPVVDKLVALGVDTVVVTGFMTQYCSVTTARHAHDLGFKVVYVQDANDGPILPQLLSGIDENAAIPLYLGIAVADVTTTDDLVNAFTASSESSTTDEL